MPPDAQDRAPRHTGVVTRVVVGLTILLVAAGAVWFLRSAREVRRDPGLVYRDPTTLGTLLKRAEDAERAGDRATAITTYRFVIGVGEGGVVEGEPAARRGGGERDAELARYVAGARAGLKRLGVADTLPGPPR